MGLERVGFVWCRSDPLQSQRHRTARVFKRSYRRETFQRACGWFGLQNSTSQLCMVTFEQIFEFLLNLYRKTRKQPGNS